MLWRNVRGKPPGKEGDCRKFKISPQRRDPVPAEGRSSLPQSCKCYRQSSSALFLPAPRQRRRIGGPFSGARHYFPNLVACGTDGRCGARRNWKI
ncbi:unnamed protein product [Nesidiocoris tenuis]|uniref:Uncharacterized protein n=2 Tax=Nesidiocoris tenuis TaxID=355587 RepID=A0ABN7AYD2_9HEMI|nr:Hypothetical protein NTJ_10010 [Nesidiocoris tenuis]CAB0008420.1 unnamed protein product [Nesidiocoris tenuis]